MLTVVDAAGTDVRILDPELALLSPAASIAACKSAFVCDVVAAVASLSVKLDVSTVVSPTLSPPNAAAAPCPT